jgi:predicted DCC family thiol-disulfide oxidoreductase YuxK
MKSIVILYDGRCVMCTKTAARLQKMKTSTSLKAIPIQDEQAASYLPVGYPIEQLQQEIHVINSGNNQIYRGPDAIFHVMTTIPSLRWLAYIQRIPGMKPIVSRIYRWIAKHRYQLFGTTDACTNGQCQLPKKE